MLKIIFSIIISNSIYVILFYIDGLGEAKEGKTTGTSAEATRRARRIDIRSTRSRTRVIKGATTAQGGVRAVS